MAAKRVIRRALVVSLVCAWLVVLTSGGVSRAPTSEKEVHLTNFKFDPPTLTIVVGDTVKWTNMDATDHDVTFEDGEKSGDPGSLGSGKAWNRTFTKKGDYRYRCVLHSGGFEGGMVGKIIVKDVSGGGGPSGPSVSLGPLPPGAMVSLGLGGLAILVSVIAIGSAFREKSPYREIDEKTVSVEVTRPRKK